MISMISALITIVLLLIVYYRPNYFLFVFGFYLTFAFFPYHQYNLDYFTILHSRLFPILLVFVLCFKFLKFNKSFLSTSFNNKGLIVYLIIIILINITLSLSHIINWGHLPYYFLRRNLISMWGLVLFIVPLEIWDLKKIIKGAYIYIITAFIFVAPMAFKYFFDTKGYSLPRFQVEPHNHHISSYLFSVVLGNFKSYYYYLDTKTILIFSVLQGAFLGICLNVYYQKNKISLKILMISGVLIMLFLFFVSQFLSTYLIFYCQLFLFILLIFINRNREKIKYFTAKTIVLVAIILSSFIFTEGSHYFDSTKNIYFGNEAYPSFSRGMLGTRFITEDHVFEKAKIKDLGGSRYARTKYALKRLHQEYFFTGTGYPPCREGCEEEKSLPLGVKGIVAPGGSELESMIVYFGFPLGLFFELLIIFPLFFFYFTKMFKHLSTYESYFFLSFFLSSMGFRFMSIWGISTSMLSLIHIMTFILLITYKKQVISNRTR